MSPRTLHTVSAVVGWAYLASSVILAVFFSYPHFYTAFAFGSWLVLDWLDWRWNGSSVLGYFYQHRHRDAFALFFFTATVFGLTIDYGYGVRLSGMWEWTAYRPIHFVRMYLFMNASYVLGMYELFRVVRSRLAPIVPARHLIRLRVGEERARRIYRACIVLGVVFMLVPLYSVALDTSRFIEYAMLFPFVGMLIASDGATGLLGGKPVTSELVRANALQVTAAAVTIALAVFVTEGLNLFGGEWKYVRMPFSEIQAFGVPVAVFVGWIPLVLGAIAVVTLAERIDLVRDRAREAARVSQE